MATDRFLPLVIWCLVQAIAVAVAALRVPLWAAAPGAGEMLAVPVLLTVQILAAAMLWPKLLANWRLALLAVAAVWPFTTLAVLLAAGPLAEVWAVGGYCSAWIAGLFLLGTPFSSTQHFAVPAAVVSTWTVSGPILEFLRREYGAGAAPSATPLAHILRGPLWNALQLSSLEQTAGVAAWSPIIALALGGFALALIARGLGRRLGPGLCASRPT